MARDMPLDEHELLAVNGVGQHKLEKYGKAFLDAIAGYRVAGG
jgi:ATP-dependent DNA helicase RecQ